MYQVKDGVELETGTLPSVPHPSQEERGYSETAVQGQGGSPYGQSLHVSSFSHTASGQRFPGSVQGLS